MILAQKVASRPWQSTVATKMAYKYPRLGDHSPSVLIVPRETINDANPSGLLSASVFICSKGGDGIQSMEQMPPISPSVLLYPTRKLRGFLNRSEAKWCVHQYKPPDVGSEEPSSACRD